ncbi:MAG: hypothetical protein J2P18_20210 [Nocardia sp.]|nr:hypothetical protein [Nocardia sp.]
MAGFDLPGADESALAELDAALESFLRRYPFTAPRTVAIRALPEGEWSQVSWIRDQAGAPVTDEVAVTTAIVLDPAGFTEQVADAVGQGFVTTGSGQRPAFSTMIRALGGGVDVAGGFVARQGAQRALISAYLGPARSDSMRAVSAAPVVGGFREWRGQLSGRSFRHGMFDPGPALAEAFTEVELLGADAGPPARVLHEVLVAAARESERPRGPR